jgi:hypothetical protein
MQKKISAILSIAFFSVLIAAGLILAGCEIAQVPQNYGYQPQNYGYQPRDYTDETQDYGYQPPPFEQGSPPDMVVAPSGSTYVYMAPDYPGVYFYQGGWYRWWDGAWYSAPGWSSSWSRVRFSAVPQVIVTMPPTYVKQFPADYNRISYRDYHSNWKKWDEQHYWHRNEWYRHELRDDVRRDRTRQAVEALSQNEKNRKDQLQEQKVQQQQQKVLQQQQHQQEKDRLQEQKVQKQQQKVLQQQQHQQEKDRLQEQKQDKDKNNNL